MKITLGRLKRILLFTLIALPFASGVSWPVTLGSEEPPDPLEAAAAIENFPPGLWWLMTMEPETPDWIIVEFKTKPVVYTVQKYPAGTAIVPLKNPERLKPEHEAYLERRPGGGWKLKHNVFCSFRFDGNKQKVPDDPPDVSMEARRWKVSVWSHTYIQGAPKPNQFYTAEFEWETDLIVRLLDHGELPVIENGGGPRIGLLFR